MDSGHRAEEPAMALAIKHVLGDELRGRGDGVGAEEHRGEHGAFGVLRPGWPAVAERFSY